MTGCDKVAIFMSTLNLFKTYRFDSNHYTLTSYRLQVKYNNCARSSLGSILFNSLKPIPVNKFLFIFAFLAEITPIVTPVIESATNDVAMHCRMTRYLRPDSQFLWRKGSETISSGSRIAIQYSDLPGSDMTGQLGTPTPTRLSSLIISDSQLSDSGIYTCFVSGSSAMAEVRLLVNGPPTQETTTGKLILN